MKLICLYEKISDNDYKLTNRYNTDFYSEESFKGQDYLILDESALPPFDAEMGFIYSYHIDINNPDKIWVEATVRELDKEERTQLVLNNYDNIVDLFNQVDALKEEVTTLKSSIAPPPAGNI